MAFDCFVFDILLLVALVVFVTGIVMLWPSYCHVIALLLPLYCHALAMAIAWQ